MILSWEEAKKYREERTEMAKTVVLTNGCFDILHVGHVRLLKEAAKHGSLIVAINTDESVTRLKGPGRPIQPAEVRGEVVDALACVDHVVFFGQDTPLELINYLRPNVLVKGSDHKIETIVGRREVESWGGRCLTIPVVEGISTTKLIERARSNGGSAQRYEVCVQEAAPLQAKWFVVEGDNFPSETIPGIIRFVTDTGRVLVFNRDHVAHIEYHAMPEKKS